LRRIALDLSKNYYPGTSKTASVPAATNATGTANATTKLDGGDPRGAV